MAYFWFFNYRIFEGRINPITLQEHKLMIMISIF